MVRVLREISKIAILIVLIIIGSTITAIYSEPIQVKANRVYKERGSFHTDLTKEERDEYMEYLRILNAETTNSIYNIELP